MKEIINRFLTKINQHAKSFAVGQTYSVYLSFKENRKQLIKDYPVEKDGIRKLISQFIKGENFDKIEVIFKDGKKPTVFSAVIPMESEPIQNTQSNPFDLGVLGLGLSGIAPEVQQQGLGAIIAAVAQKQVDEKFQAQDLILKNQLIDSQKAEIEKLNKKIQELIDTLNSKESEIAEVRAMKQSFSLKGLDVPEFLGLTLGSIAKKYPNFMGLFGVPKEAVLKAFERDEEIEEAKETKQIANVDDDEDGGATPVNLSNDEKIRQTAIDGFTKYAKALANDEFKEVMEINIDLQHLPLEKKKTIHELIIAENNG